MGVKKYVTLETGEGEYAMFSVSYWCAVEQA